MSKEYIDGLREKLQMINKMHEINKKKEPVKDILDNIVEDHKDILKVNSFFSKKIINELKERHKLLTKPSPFEKILCSFMDEHYSTNPGLRFIKLSEEHNDLQQAWKEWRELPNQDTWNHLLEKLSDLQAVLTHISSILEVPYKTLLLEAHKKATRRLKNPNYKQDGNNNNRNRK